MQSFSGLNSKPVNIDRQLLYEEEHAEIFFDAKINATGVVWKRPVTSEQYEWFSRNASISSTSYNTPNYISGHVETRDRIAHEDQRWMFEEILPHALANGLKEDSRRLDLLFADPTVRGIYMD
jgi:hypothetical protein